MTYNQLKIKRLKNIFLVLIIIVSVGCEGEPNLKRNTQEVEIVIFDTDMGSDCDDVGALALLHYYVNQGQAEIIGCIYSSGKIPYGAAVTQAINNYYERPQIPIGAYQKDDIGDPKDKMSAEKLARDTAAYGHQIITNQDAQDHLKLNRELLATSKNKSITYITVGHTKALYDLLVSKPDEISALSGRDLISQKIKKWVALGALKSNNQEGNYTKDWNFFFNGTAPYTEYLVHNFPIPVYYVDAGHKVMTGRGLVNTPTGNIVRTAYRDWLWNVGNKTLQDQRPSWDLAAVYFAIEGEGDFLTEAPEGYLDFDAEKGCRWIEQPDSSRQHYISQKPATDELFAGYLNQILEQVTLKNSSQ